jgi:hypothetical protein
VVVVVDWGSVVVVVDVVVEGVVFVDVVVFAGSGSRSSCLRGSTA